MASVGKTPKCNGSSVRGERIVGGKVSVRSGRETALRSGCEREEHNAARTTWGALIEHHHGLAVRSPDRPARDRGPAGRVRQSTLRAAECGDRVDPIAFAIAAGKGDLPPIRRPLRGAGNTVAALVVCELQRRVASYQLHIDVVVCALHTIPNECDLTPVRRKRRGFRVSERARENRRTQIRRPHVRLALGWLRLKGGSKRSRSNKHGDSNCRY